MTQFNAALVIIGNEILSGRTQDANVPWLAQALNECGVDLAEVRVVRDIAADIIAAVNELRARYSYVFTTGGIGPTHDDITSESIAAAFGVEWELNEDALRTLIAYYGREEDVTPARRKMAMIPAGADLIDNPVSGAPGFRIGNVHVMAGVPRIMQAMFDSIRGGLKGGRPMLSATVTCNLPESVIAQALERIQKNHPETDIGSYPNYRGGFASLSVVIRGRDSAQLDVVVAEVVGMVAALGGAPTAVSQSSDA